MTSVDRLQHHVSLGNQRCETAETRSSPSRTHSQNKLVKVTFKSSSMPSKSIQRLSLSQYLYSLIAGYCRDFAMPMWLASNSNIHSQCSMLILYFKIATIYIVALAAESNAYNIIWFNMISYIMIKMFTSIFDSVGSETGRASSWGLGFTDINCGN